MSESVHILLNLKIAGCKIARAAMQICTAPMVKVKVQQSALFFNEESSPWFKTFNINATSVAGSSVL